MRTARWSAALITAAALLEATPVPAAEAISAGLAHCVAIANAEARLACYDALAGRSAPVAATSTPSAPAPSAPTAPAPAMPAKTTPAAVAPVAAAAAASMVVAPPDPAEAAENFGLSSAQFHSAPQGPRSIEAHVAQLTSDRALRSYVVLDNGQTWVSTEGGLDLVTGEQVTIKRAALGSFMLVSAASKHSYHVRRVR